MLTGFVKLRRRRRRVSKRVSFRAIANRIRVPEVVKRNDTVLYDKEYLKNKNLSIMTDNEPDFYLQDPIIRKRINERKLKAISGSSRGSFHEYVIVAVEEQPVTTNSKSVNNNYDSANVNRNTDSVSSKNPRPKCHKTWYMKFKRQIIKALRNKVYPHVITG